MSWVIQFHDDFYPEFQALVAEVQDELLAQLKVVRLFGPETGRPRVDTLNGSKHANMKELRFDAGGGVWRVAFAFDPKRRAVLLVAGDKSGISEKKFYKQLIKKADARYDSHVKELTQATEKTKGEKKS